MSSRLTIILALVGMGCSKAGGPSESLASSATAGPSASATSLSPPPRTIAAPAPTAPPDFATLPQYKFDKANVDAFCREEWTKRGELDTSMFNYCAAQEKEGHAKMLAALKKFGKNDWMTTLFPAIWEEWTKRGVTQYRMVGHSVAQQGDAFLDFQYEQKQPKLDATKMGRCVAEWQAHASRWTQTMYCYKN